MRNLSRNKDGFTPSGVEGQALHSSGQALHTSGQALLLVLLSMAVVLTVVLSILSRSVTDIGVTTADESALRAFSAAEAGVEQALVTGLSVLNPVSIGDATFTANVTGISFGTKEFVMPSNLSAGESVVVWFVSHGSDGNLICNTDNPCFTGNSIQVCWGKEGTSSSLASTPAIEVSVFYKEPAGGYSTAKIARGTADPNQSRSTPNLFSNIGSGPCQVSGQNFAFRKTLNFNSDLSIPPSVSGSPNGLQFARIRILYNTDMAQPVGVSVTGNSNLPAQGMKINSQGVSGEANRGVEVYQGYPEPPLIFNSALFSNGGITQ